MSYSYDLYLHEHIDNVRKAYEWLVDNIPEVEKRLLAESEMVDCAAHDLSKFSKEEYDAYDKYFYGGNRSFSVVNNFNYAWLSHIHNNPHHWQYWVLQYDDEPEEALEMPYNYVIEMICDWWSFSWKNKDPYSIFDWYEKHKDMKLHPKTRKLVEDILEKIKTKLDEEKANGES